MAVALQWLGKLGQVVLAAEIYNKIGDEAGLVDLYVSNRRWQDAFKLAESNPGLHESIYLPYANMLAENDQFEEAQEAFRKAGHAEKAIEVLEILTHNAVMESRFGDAGYYFWQLSIAALGNMADYKDGSEVPDEMMKQMQDFQRRADLYYAYDSIQRYIAEPFTSHQPESLFNIARYLLHAIKDSVPMGVSKVAILYSLAKQSRNLGAFKLARHAYETLQTLRVPTAFREQIDLGAISIRSKPYSDAEDVLPLCYRCSHQAPLLNLTEPYRCTSCKQGFVYSFHSFEVLPLVEFEVENGIENEEAVGLIEDESRVGKAAGGWKEESSGGADVMNLHDNTEGQDPFTSQFMRFQAGEAFSPVVADRDMLKSMPASEVFVQQWPAPLNFRYYRNVLPEIAVSHCSHCNNVRPLPMVPAAGVLVSFKL